MATATLTAPAMPIAMAVGGFLALAEPASAWGNAGHRIVCDLAYQLMSRDGKRFLREIRSEGGLDEPKLFYETCFWADVVRGTTFQGTYTYHFVNIPRSKGAFDLARDCAALDCVTAAVQRYAAVVARDPGRSPSARKARSQALRFLAHFVADLHQPLHAADGEDLGGNKLAVSWFGEARTGSRAMQLHRVWDTQILAKAGYSSPASWQLLLEAIKERDVSGWKTFDLVSWTEDSYSLAQSHAYRYSDTTRVTQGDDLGARYYTRAKPVVELQLMKAAVRLAHIIDAAAAGTLPRNLAEFGRAQQ